MAHAAWCDHIEPESCIAAHQYARVSVEFEEIGRLSRINFVIKVHNELIGGHLVVARTGPRQVLALIMQGTGQGCNYQR